MHQSVFAQAKLDGLLKVLGIMHGKGQYEEMLELSMEGEEMVLGASELDSLKLMQFRGQKAKALYQLGNYISALSVYDETLAYNPTSNDGKKFKANILHDKSFMEDRLGQYVTSYETTKHAENLMSQVSEPDYDFLLTIYADLGRGAARLGYYEEGEYYLNKGLRLYQENSDKIIYLNPQKAVDKLILLEYNFVYLCSYAQEEDKMLFHLGEIEKLRQKKIFNDREELVYAVALNFAADYYLVHAGNDYFGKKDLPNLYKILNKAEKYLDKALEHLDQKAFYGNYLQFRFNLAKKHLYAGEFSKAQINNQEILDAIDQNDARKSFFLAQKGLILMEKGKRLEMLEQFRQMLKGIHTGEEALEEDLGNFKPSYNLNHAGLLIQIADKLYQTFSEDSVVLAFVSHLYTAAMIQFVNCYQGKGFNEKLQELYEGALGGILKMKFLGYGEDHMLPEYLNEIENIENHFAWQEFTQNQQLNSFQLPDTLHYKEIVLRQKLVAARKNKDQLLTFELEDQLSKLKQHIKQTFPRLFSFAYERFDYKLLREDFEEGTLILRYKKFRDRWYVFIISDEGLTLAQLFTADALDKQITSYVRLLTSMEENKDLGKWLLEKLIPVNWQEKSHVIIIPDKELRHLPFETLVHDDNQYLINKLSISYAPHLIFSTDTFFNVKKSDSDAGVLIFAPTYEENPTSEVALRQLTYRLEGAEKEAEHLAETYYGKHFIGNQASKQNFMMHAPEAQVLHLSMHANIDPQIPELSYLLFSGKGDQGKMYMEELYAMSLGAKMAVLSACNTGKNIFNKRKGYTSIHQAFTFAGVPTTLSSLWEVPDKATQQIMQAFYQYIKQGLPKSVALQKAKLDYMHNCKDPNFNKPFFWAGFVLNGDISPLSISARSFIWRVILILMVIMLSLGGWWISRNMRRRVKRVRQ